MANCRSLKKRTKPYYPLNLWKTLHLELSVDFQFSTQENSVQVIPSRRLLLHRSKRAQVDIISLSNSIFKDGSMILQARINSSFIAKKCSEHATCIFSSQLYNISRIHSIGIARAHSTESSIIHQLSSIFSHMHTTISFNSLKSFLMN